MYVASEKHIPSWTTIPTAWGNCGILWKSDKLRRIVLPGLTDDELRRELLKHHPFANESQVMPNWFADLQRFLQGYYANAPRDCTASLRSCLDWPQVSAFCRQVLETTCKIKRGQVRTYGEIARELGNAKASRAVGAALGSNPWPLLVPCHRVVGANGQMTGFSAQGGVETKRRMLALEGAPRRL
ncbi:MAG: methylated-DNA--[protein]-cysteine S-methyltransferase [Phycisphaerales bacterium]|nr:methylated-DNA--[protein]-cysteine S-methyltransferase [Phycisphaerales bacterium]